MSSPRRLTLSECRRAADEDASEWIRDVHARVTEHRDQAVFIEASTLDNLRSQLARQRARRESGASLPWYGVPIAVKDNIDVEGLPTTAGCPAFAYQAQSSAPAVARLLDAGAIVVGKTNLDQFATGLVGVRSPYGIPRSAIDPRYVSGGSSSGSALAVAHGIVPIALGTDTAGSGRVPAAFNGIVGLKPTRGLVSTRGVVPACRSLDCVSVFANTIEDAASTLEVIAGFDGKDSFSRPAPPERQGARRDELRVGVPKDLDWFGNAQYERAYAAMVERVAALGHECVTIDIEPFLAAGRLLYGGPWVAERYASVGEFVERHPSQVHPVVRDIVLSGKQYRAHELFEAEYALRRLRRVAEATWDVVDTLMLPTTGTIYTVEEVLIDPVASNANLGLYTNFVNLLDLSGLAIPAGVTDGGAPFGVTLLAQAFSESLLTRLGGELCHD